MKIQDMPLNAKTAKIIAKRVMKDNNMSVVKNFTPVVSEYKFNLSDTKRMNIILKEDEYIQQEERLINNSWKKVIEYRLKGNIEKVENELIEFLNSLKNNIR